MWAKAGKVGKVSLFVYVNPFPSKPWFLRVCRRSLFENTVGKGEIARNEQFLLFHGVFYPLEERSAIFIKFEIVVCKLFQFGRD